MSERGSSGRTRLATLALLALAIAALSGAVRAPAGLAGASPVNSWQGVNDQSSDPNQTPPSSDGAVGPTRYVEVASGSYGIYDRSKNKLSSGLLGDLTGTGADFVVEPHVLWDPDTDRFYFAALDASENVFVYGFSSSNSPSGPGDWCTYTHSFGFNADFYPGELHLGDTQDFLLLGVDAYSWDTSLFDHSEVDWVAKPSGSGCPGAGLSGAQTNLTDSSGHPAFSPVPVNQIDGSSTGWIVAADLSTGTRLSLFQVTKNGGGSASVATSGSPVTVSKFSPPPDASQAGTSVKLDTLDGRLTQAVSAIDPLRGGVGIWTQHTVAGGAGSQIRWYEINPASAGLYQSGSVTGGSLAVFNGAISPDRVRSGSTSAFGSTMGLGFETSSSRTQPAIQMVAKVGNNPQQAIVPVLPSPQLLSPPPMGSEQDYSCDVGCDWGTYAGASPDPAADTSKATGMVWFTNAWSAPSSAASSADAAADVDWRTWNWSSVLAAPPTISSLSAASGFVGTSVTINGARFTGVYQVTFGGIPATFKLASDGVVTAAVPAAALTGKIGVSTLDGTGLSAATFVVQPRITSLSPTRAGAGTTLKIQGTGLAGVNDVSFSGVHTAPTSVTPTAVQVIVPAGAMPGPVTVTAPGGGSATSTMSFVVLPSITGFSVPSGVWGTGVTILGGGFAGATSVLFNGISASFTVVDSGHITTTVPVGASTGPVTVANPTASFRSKASFLVLPHVSGFSPPSGVTGSHVTLTGTAFIGVRSVTLNGLKPTFHVNSPTSLDMTVPATATDGPIVVTTGGGTASTGGSFLVLPSISSVPKNGVVGRSITISGGGLSGVSAVDFNGAPASFTSVSPTSLTATIPVGASTGPIHVTALHGTAVSAVFTVLPGIAGFSSPSGTWGSHVTILGAGLGGATSVLFNGVNASFAVVDSGHIDATVPAGSSTGQVTVTTGGGTVRSSASFLVLPHITSFGPGSGTVGSTVTLTGTAFIGVTGVTFGGVKASIKVTSPTSIDATVPAAATDGPIAVTSKGGTGNSAGNFKVLPSIQKFSPSSGAVGKSITISGGGFNSVMSVNFNGTSASFTPVSATSLRATVPAGAMSGPVHVTTPNGTATSAASFTVSP